MKIRIDDPQLVDELVHHLRRSGCLASATDLEADGDGVILDVQLPASRDEKQARMELELYLKVFEATTGKAASILT